MKKESNGVAPSDGFLLDAALNEIHEQRIRDFGDVRLQMRNREHDGERRVRELTNQD